MNKIKKLSSLATAFAVLLSSLVFQIGVAADNTYILKTYTDDIYNNGYMSTYSHSNIIGAEKLIFDYGTLPGGKYYAFPYVGNSTTEPKVEAIWKSDCAMESFFMDAVYHKNFTDNYPETAYAFYYSENGTDWTKISYTIGERTYISGSDLTTARLTVDTIPSSALYVRFLSLLTGVNNGDCWCSGFKSVGWTYKEKLAKPELCAEYKNMYGVYANPVLNGAIVKRDVKITVANIEDAAAKGKVIVEKDGNLVKSDDYYNSLSGAYEFKENGSYTITAENLAGSSSVSFKLKKVAEDSVVTKTVIDDIYNTGKTNAISYSNIEAGYKAIFSYGDLPDGKHYMFPYVGGTEEPMAEAVWYSERSIECFFMDAVYHKNFTDNYPETAYAFYYSENGTDWTKADYTIGTRSAIAGTNLTTARLTVEKIPDNARYIKFLSLIIGKNNGNCWCSGFMRTGYSVYVINPTIDAKFKDALGGISSPVANGAMVPSEVTIKFADVENDNITVKRNSQPYTLSTDGVLTEEGEYEVTAVNAKGTTVLTFTIDFSCAAAEYESYVFTGGTDDAAEQYRKLLSITPNGATSDFTKGDGKINVTYTDTTKPSDQNWWGLTEGGTRLTIGNGSGGFNSDGYFYFVNKGADGKKYNGASITYTVPDRDDLQKDAELLIYAADRYDGEYKLIQPSIFTKQSGTGAVATCTATYYFGDELSVIKVQYNPNAPTADIWKGLYLAILKISKLSIPTLEATANNTTVVNNKVVSGNVSLNVSNALYWFAEKDGVRIETPANGVLTEDGAYRVVACNYAGSMALSFYIAKSSPAIELVDKLGNYLSSGSTSVDDVRAVFYNTDTVITTLNGETYSDKAEQLLDINGEYKFTAIKGNASLEYTFTLNRPLPSLTATDFRGKTIDNGSTVDTTVKFIMKTFDSFTVTLNGKPITIAEGEKLTKEGKYVIEVVNKAGKTMLEFTLKYNLELAVVEHTGDTVVKIDYHKRKQSDFQEWAYKLENIMLDETGGLVNEWTGFTGPVLHPTVTGESDAYITYKAPKFKSFAFYGTLPPSTKVASADEVYSMYTSSNGKDFVKLEYRLEKDLAYITTGHTRYRFTALNIPQNTRYIKVCFDQTLAAASYENCIPYVEFSYNKADFGKLDENDVLFMISDSFDGDVVNVDIYNKDTVISKRIFEAINGNDITLRFNLLNSKDEKEYSLSFNGLTIDEPSDFIVGVKIVQSKGAAYAAKFDDKAFGIELSQKGKWTMEVTLGVALSKLSKLQSYALYLYENNALTLIEKATAHSDGVFYYVLPQYGDFVFTENAGLAKEDDEAVNTPEDIDNPNEKTDESEEEEPIYMMVENRKRFIGSNGGTSIVFWITVITVCVLAAVGAVTLIILKNKGIIFNKKGKMLK